MGRITDNGKIKQEYAIFWRLWKKAFREGKAEIKFATNADAVRARFGMYNSVKSIRSGKLIEPEVKEAVENCSVSVTDCLLTVMASRNKPEISAILAQLGEDFDTVVGEEPRPQTHEELEIIDMQSRILGNLQTGTGGGDSVPQRDRPRVDYAELAKRMKEGGGE